MFDEDEIISKLNEEKNLNEIAQELNISVLEAHYGFKKWWDGI